MGQGGVCAAAHGAGARVGRSGARGRQEVHTTRSRARGHARAGPLAHRRAPAGRRAGSGRAAGRRPGRPGARRRGTRGPRRGRRRAGRWWRRTCTAPPSGRPCPGCCHRSRGSRSSCVSGGAVRRLIVWAPAAAIWPTLCAAAARPGVRTWPPSTACWSASPRTLSRSCPSPLPRQTGKGPKGHRSRRRSSWPCCSGRLVSWCGARCQGAAGCRRQIQNSEHSLSYIYSLLIAGV